MQIKRQNISKYLEIFAFFNKLSKFLTFHSIFWQNFLFTLANVKNFL